MPIIGAKFDRHAVVGRLDPGRQLGLQRAIVEVVVHVGDHCAARRGAGDPVEALREVGYASGAACGAGASSTQTSSPSKRRPGLVRDRRDVGQVGEAADAEAERIDPAVLRRGTAEGDRSAGAVDGERPVDRPEVEDRRIEAARRLHEDVGEARDQHLGGLGVGPDRQPAAAVVHDGPQVVDAVDMVGVRMGIDHAVEQPDPGGEQLRRAGRAWCRSARAWCRRRSRCSRSSEQRLRRFLGSAGSQAPQSPPIRGTPADEPQPRMVTRSRAVTPRPSRTAGRSSPRSARRARPGRCPRWPAISRAVSAT